MRTISVQESSFNSFQEGYYEATVETGVIFKNSSQELLVFTDVEMLNPDEFVEKFKVLSEGDLIGAWFGENDLSLWLQLFN